MRWAWAWLFGIWLLALALGGVHPVMLPAAVVSIAVYASGFAWIGLYRPTADELGAVAKEFDLPPLAVEDALSGHQRSKIEKYGSLLFVVLRPADYLDETEKVEFGEVHVFLGEDFIITVRHFESPDLARVRHRLENDTALLADGPIAALYGILDEIVDEYVPVVAGLEDDIDEIEDQLFSGDRGVSRRIFELFKPSHEPTMPNLAHAASPAEPRIAGDMFSTALARHG